MPTWPADLPQQIERPGYREGAAEPLRSQSATVDKARRISTATPKPLRATMLLSQDQWRRLLAFHETDLAGGALSFDFPDPFPGRGHDSAPIHSAADPDHLGRRCVSHYITLPDPLGLKGAHHGPASGTGTAFHHFIHARRV